MQITYFYHIFVHHIHIVICLKKNNSYISVIFNLNNLVSESMGQYFKEVNTFIFLLTKNHKKKTT